MNYGPMQPPPKKPGFPIWAIVLIAVGGVGFLFMSIFIALGIYGARRYLVAAKTAEAKNTVGAIARSAVAAFERERMDTPGASVHALCASSGPDAPGHGPVPAVVPKGTKYAPAAADFDTGSETGGWKCLRFSLMQPMYYQVHYNRGAGYLASVHAPPAGVDGFEAAARGDLDANGVSSLFSRTGVVKDGQVQLSTQIYVENEFE